MITKIVDNRLNLEKDLFINTSIFEKAPFFQDDSHRPVTNDSICDSLNKEVKPIRSKIPYIFWDLLLIFNLLFCGYADLYIECNKQKNESF